MVKFNTTYKTKAGEVKEAGEVKLNKAKKVVTLNSFNQSNKPDNDLNFSKSQLQTILNSFSSKNSIHDLMELTINSLLKTEREIYLDMEKERYLESIHKNDECGGEHSEEDKIKTIKNKANGYRYRKFLGDGKLLTLTIPRDRLGTFKPVITAILNERQELARELCFDLYSKGLTTKDISEVIESVYGREYDENRISQFNTIFWKEMRLWRDRKLDCYYPVIYLDCIFQKVKREGNYESEAFYIVLALKEDYTREVIGIYNNPTETSVYWKEILDDLKNRGVEDINLIVADGINNLENEVGKVFPKVKLQKCVTHLKRNILLRVKTKDKIELAEDLRYIFDLQKDSNPEEELKNSKERINKVIQKWGRYPHLRTILTAKTIDYYFTYLNFNKNIRDMIYTTNWIERLNKTFRKSLRIRNTMPNVESCLALLSKVAMNTNNKTYSYKISRFNSSNL